MPWPQLQRILIAPWVEELLQLAEAIVGQHDSDRRGIAFCRQQLQLPAAQLDPPPLLSGNDLLEAGYRAGPQFRTVLERVRDAQLEGQIETHQEALELARRLIHDGQSR